MIDKSQIENIQPEPLPGNGLKADVASVRPTIGNTHVVGSTAILGDCVQLMKGYDDNYFDLAIVDPPYGIGVNMNMGLRKGKRRRREDKDWDNEIPSEDYFTELKRVSKHQIIWGGNYFPNLNMYNPKAKRLADFKELKGIVWDKAETMYGRDFSEAEIAFSTVGTGWFKLSPVQPLRFHPTQKPVKLYKWLLATFALAGMKILDTHLGSQSSRIAACELGFDFTGFEIDKKYFEAGCKRYEQYKSQLRIEGW
jgi:site-specific DNA-methyltransferase (adenine-specific)